MLILNVLVAGIVKVAVHMQGEVVLPTTRYVAKAKRFESPGMKTDEINNLIWKDMFAGLVSISVLIQWDNERPSSRRRILMISRRVSL